MSAEAAKLFIGNLSWKTTSEDLRSTFSQFGNVTDAVVINDRETGRSRGFGFVTFDSTESANVAINKMDNQDMGGRNIRVNFAEQRRERTPRAASYGGEL